MKPNPWNRSFLPDRHAGFSLLEVLIALLVFSVGLLGLAAMLVSAVKGNHLAYYHSQAVYVAEAMADGMRANLAAVNRGDYNVDLGEAPGGEECTICTSVGLAGRDLLQWAQMAEERLPNGEIGIDCPAPASAGGEASYRGMCTLQVAWMESGDEGQSDAASQRVFTWMVQP